ncbi:MAG: hypothetical protein NPIRA04_23010 [Nitrospirales bacterium]|nr:MAG: hypothetical protein NPIRA04_23010 [Nitrospirales bacterium]
MILLPTHLVAIESPVNHIAMKGFAPYYTPEFATVLAGYPIQWDNRTATAHTVTHDGCLTGESCAFDSGAISPENSFNLLSLQPGTYPYYCRLHPIMRGVITVIEPTVN